MDETGDPGHADDPGDLDDRVVPPPAVRPPARPGADADADADAGPVGPPAPVTAPDPDPVPVPVPDTRDDRDRVIALVERVASLEARVAALHAEQLSVLSNLAVDRFVDENDVDLVVELGARCRWTSYTADRRLGTAMRLAACFPLLLADLAGGELDLHRVLVVVSEAELLDEEQALVLDAVVAGSLTGLTTAQVKALVRSQIAVIDSDAVRERARRVLARRRVEFAALEDGAASLLLVGPAEAVRGVYDRLDVLARDTTRPGAGTDPYAGLSTPAGADAPDGAGAQDRSGAPGRDGARGGADGAGPVERDRRGIDAQRFDACVELLRAPVAGAPGVATGTGPHIHLALSSAVGLDDLPAHLSGYGPVPAERVRRLLTHTGFRRVVTDPLTGHVVTVDGHTFPAGTLPDLSGPDLSGPGPSGSAPDGPGVSALDVSALDAPLVDGLMGDGVTVDGSATSASAVTGASTAVAGPRVRATTRTQRETADPWVADDRPGSPERLSASPPVVTTPGEDPTSPVPGIVDRSVTADAPADAVPAPDVSAGDPVLDARVDDPARPGGTHDPARSAGVEDLGRLARAHDPERSARAGDAARSARAADAAPPWVPDEVEARDPGPGWNAAENGYDSGFDHATDDPAEADPVEGPRDSEFTVTLDIAGLRPATLVGPQLVSDPDLWAAAARARALASLRACPVVMGGDRTYRFSAALRRHLTLRSPHCTAPGCRAPAHRCDLDHTTDHALGGPTCPCNTAPLCRRHHRTKHARGWTPVRTTDDPSDPTTTWLSPLGYLYTVPATALLPTAAGTAALVGAHLRRRRRAAAALEAAHAARTPIAAIHAAYAAMKADAEREAEREAEDQAGGPVLVPGPGTPVTGYRQHTADHVWEDGCRECEPDQLLSLRRPGVPSEGGTAATGSTSGIPSGGRANASATEGRPSSDLGDPPF